ncbi:MAG: KpsF/GutQ family sugar-phosphate isomerase [Puniceicoccales bacterium]|jgi:arabinose-5-phosphate isomerase|nr:KpsF/GutQ family sugar-phosphate isomerase [Puniceicoccales bacterium]
MTDAPDAALAIGKRLLRHEADALGALAARLDAEFERAVSLIYGRGSKVVLTGVGKSGLVARKIAATFCGTGTSAIFLHPADAVHGDLGVFQPGDPAILISKSGATAEVVRLLPVIKKFGSPIVAIVANAASPIAEQADVVLDIGEKSEAGPLGLAPTTSALLSLALGDALAAALMARRGFGADDFALLHPAGQLGRNLLLTVGEAMHPLDAVATVAPETPVSELLIAMTRFPLGAAVVLDAAGALAGLVTDGDVRRGLEQVSRARQRGEKSDLLELPASTLMTAKPVFAPPTLSLGDAARLMEDRPSQLSVLPVLTPGTRRCLGLLRIHDIYHAKMV